MHHFRFVSHAEEPRFTTSSVSKPFFFGTPASQLEYEQAMYTLGQGVGRSESRSAGPIVAAMLGGLGTELSDPVSEHESLLGAKFRFKKVDLNADLHRMQLSLY